VKTVSGTYISQHVIQFVSDFPPTPDRI
jgi:hypothetical protein